MQIYLQNYRFDIIEKYVLFTRIHTSNSELQIVAFGLMIKNMQIWINLNNDNNFHNKYSYKKY